jgi:hypothetical protein
VTAAAHCEVWPVWTEAGTQDAATEVMVGGAAVGFNVMAAEAVFVMSVLLVAVKVTVVVAPIVDGAV